MLPLIMIGASMAMGAASAAQNNVASSNQYVNSLKGVNATNEAIAAANVANTIRTGYRVGILNVQKAQATKASVQSGYDLSAQGIQAMGTNEANSAASGTIGASVDAVSNNIRKKAAEAQIDIDVNYETTMMNFDNQLNDLVQQGIDSLKSPITADTSGPATQNQFTAALMAGVQSGIGYATQYGVSKMKLDVATPARQLSNTAPLGSGISLPNVGGTYTYSPFGKP